VYREHPLEDCRRSRSERAGELRDLAKKGENPKKRRCILPKRRRLIIEQWGKNREKGGCNLLQTTHTGNGEKTGREDRPNTFGLSILTSSKKEVGSGRGQVAWFKKDKSK